MTVGHAGEPLELSLRYGDVRYRAAIAVACAAELVDMELNVGRLLHPNEAAYLQRLCHARRRQSYILGRVAAKRAIGRVVHVPPWHRIDIATGVFRQPVVRLADENCPDVSISHCEGLGVAVAFAPELLLAIDVERCTADAASAARKLLNPGEAGLLARCGWNEVVTSTVQWSAKEALSKAMKFGLTVPPEILCISSVETIDVQSVVLGFQNFPQYVCFSRLYGQTALSLALPRHAQSLDLRGLAQLDIGGMERPGILSAQAGQ
jgi:4'-phosphopantetheinyl transferase